jgi:hypothetical protein
MIRAVTTLVYGIVLAVLVVAVAILASIWVLGMAAKAALFGEPKSSLAMKVVERIMKERNSTDITHITPETEETNET